MVVKLTLGLWLTVAVLAIDLLQLAALPENAFRVME
jgi:hypothetical protein